MARLAQAVETLAAGDPDLAGIVARFGLPPLWAREPGFPTLLHIVLEQQVSLASARAAFDRLTAVADPLTPGRFLELSDAQLLEVGFSRQKARYGRALATAIEIPGARPGRPGPSRRRHRPRPAPVDPGDRSVDVERSTS